MIFDFFSSFKKERFRYNAIKIQFRYNAIKIQFRYNAIKTYSILSTEKMSLIPEKHNIIMKLLDNDEFVEDVWNFIEPRIKRIRNPADKTHVQYMCRSGKTVEEKKQSIIPHKISINSIVNYAKIDERYWIITHECVYEMEEMIYNTDQIDKNVEKTAVKFLSFDDAGNLKFKIDECVGKFNMSDVKFGFARNGYLSVSTKDGSRTIDMRSVMGSLEHIIEKYPAIYRDEQFSTSSTQLF